MKHVESKNMSILIATVAELTTGLIKSAQVEDPDFDAGLANPRLVVSDLKSLTTSPDELVMVCASPNGMHTDVTFESATKEVAEYMINQMPEDETSPEATAWLKKQLPTLPNQEDSSCSGIFMQVDDNPVFHDSLPARLGLA